MSDGMDKVKEFIHDAAGEIQKVQVKAKEIRKKAQAKMDDLNLSMPKFKKNKDGDVEVEIESKDESTKPFRISAVKTNASAGSAPRTRVKIVENEQESEFEVSKKGFSLFSLFKRNKEDSE